MDKELESAIREYLAKTCLQICGDFWTELGNVV